MLPTPPSWLSKETEAIVALSRPKQGRGRRWAVFAAVCSATVVAAAAILMAFDPFGPAPVGTKTGVPASRAEDDPGPRVPVPQDNPPDPVPRTPKEPSSPWWFPKEEPPPERPDQ
jgi:hypothetical protein